MRQGKAGTIATASLILLVTFGTTHRAGAQDAGTRYPGMAPIDQYLMDRGAEIALARTAAPASISRDAEVMVLGSHGFESAARGTNGFVCIVERSWSAAPDPDFWNPRVRVPECYNAAAARSYLLRTLRATDLVLAGRTRAEVDSAIDAAADSGTLPPMAPGAMCYMMGKAGYAGDSAKHWPPHLMFFYTHTDPVTWGAGLRGSPILASSDQRLTMFAVPVPQWADGTPSR